MLSDMLQEHDEPILKHLKDIQVKFSEPGQPMSFTLEFHFEPNGYFNNAVLTKVYKMKSEPDASDPFSFEGPEIIDCEGCQIDWHKGKDVTVKTIKKKQKHKGRGTIRTVTKQVSNDSFFNFFNPIKGKPNTAPWSALRTALSSVRTCVERVSLGGSWLVPGVGAGGCPELLGGYGVLVWGCGCPSPVGPCVGHSRRGGGAAFLAGLGQRSLSLRASLLSGSGGLAAVLLALAWVAGLVARAAVVPCRFPCGVGGISAAAAAAVGVLGWGWLGTLPPSCHVPPSILEEHKHSPEHRC
ncbi:nucleosome assembly protein 1-like 4a isoform X4 [Oryzias latipes]